MDDSVKKWIEKKLEEGVGEDRIKKSLKKTGRDPGLVDEVQSPFEGREKDTEDVEEEKRTPSSEQEEDEGEEFDSLSFVDDEDKEDTEDVEEEEPEEGTGERESEEETVEEEDSGNVFNLPSSIVPAIHVGRKKLFIVLVVLLIAGLGYPGFNLLDNSALSNISNPISPSCDRGVGVKLYSAGVSREETVAEVYTDQRAEMVLEVFSGESKMGEGTKVIDGRGVIRVDAVGDRAVFHEKGCDEPFSETSY